MTPLKKLWQRRTEKAYNVLRSGAKKARPIVVSLIPGGGSDDLIGFRELGTRRIFTAPIADLFKIVVHREALRSAAEKRAARKAKRS